MATTDVPTPAVLPAPSRWRRRRWIWLLVGCILIAGGLLACAGWAAWQEQLAGRALAGDRMEEAKRHIDRALLVRRRSVSTLLLAARIRRLTGDYSAAEQSLLRCSQIDGMSDPVHLEWLLLRCQQGEIDELYRGASSFS